MARYGSDDHDDHDAIVCFTVGEPPGRAGGPAPIFRLGWRHGWQSPESRLRLKKAVTAPALGPEGQRTVIRIECSADACLCGLLYGRRGQPLRPIVERTCRSSSSVLVAKVRFGNIISGVQMQT